MRGEFLDVHPSELRPYDILGEGRVIKELRSWSGRPGVVDLVVGPCHAEVEVIELAGGPCCHWHPVWGETVREPLEFGPYRIFRGDLPGYFCTAEPDGSRDPCDSDRCPIRTALIDGSECVQ